MKCKDNKYRLVKLEEANAEANKTVKGISHETGQNVQDRSETLSSDEKMNETAALETDDKMNEASASETEEKMQDTSTPETDDKMSEPSTQDTDAKMNVSVRN